ncbi:MAG: hypothetical protein C5B50_19460 [Verrucomicrobia bacterium]|nr:MAG: hypothetical protein C5B50_19460 [Verrucomicrobiota bacterium]
MNLDESQRKQVAQWIVQGAKLSEIQNRLASELGVRLTYMEVRLLVDDLKLTPKDPEPTKPGQSTSLGTGSPGRSGRQTPEASASPASVSLSVDQVTRPGAMVSGKVTFSDRNQADWYIDQTGRLGVVPQKQGYRPTASDLEQFQRELESELSRLGL